MSVTWISIWYAVSVICFNKVRIFDQYTFYNLALIPISLILKNAFLNTALLTNSVSIFITFHSVMLHDNNAFYKMSHRGDTTPLIWYILHVMGHILPVPMMYYSTIEPHMGLMAGMVSCLHHLTWTFVRHRGLILNTAYIELPERAWYILWTTAVFSHIMTGSLLQLTSRSC
jgi:hypothetical protein